MAGGKRQGRRAATIRGDARGARQDVQTRRDPGRPLCRTDDGAAGAVASFSGGAATLADDALRPAVLAAFDAGGFAFGRSGMIGSSRKFSRPPPIWIAVLPP